MFGWIKKIFKDEPQPLNIKITSPQDNTDWLSEAIKTACSDNSPCDTEPDTFTGSSDSAGLDYEPCPPYFLEPLSPEIASSKPVIRVRGAGKRTTKKPGSKSGTKSTKKSATKKSSRKP